MPVDFGHSPVVRGLIQGAGLAQQIKSQMMQDQLFQMRKDEISQDREVRAEAKRDRGFDRKLGMINSGARTVQGGQVRDDSQGALAESGPAKLNGVSFPGAEVRMPTFLRPAQSERTLSIQDENGADQSYELPSMQERQQQARGMTLQKLRDELSAAVAKEDMLGPVKARNAGMTKAAEVGAESVDADLLTQALNGKASGMMAPALQRAVAAGNQLRSQTGMRDADRTSRESIADANRVAADGRAEANRGNSRSIAGMHEAAANARHATPAGGAGNKLPQLDERQKQKLAVIRSLDTEILRLNGAMAKLDPGNRSTGPDRARMKNLRDAYTKQKQAEETALEKDRLDVDGREARRYLGIP